MSRSIHTTIKNYSMERKYQFRDEEIKESRLNDIRDELRKKRLIKQGKLLSRKLEGITFEINESFDPATVPIDTVDKSEYIHYPALAYDLVEVAKRLPVNVMVGLQSITFCLGKEYQEKKWDGSHDVRDPFTGRLTLDEEGPFYGPPILGMYNPKKAKIFLCAYVYNKILLKTDVVESYLRLKMLSTFVHEVAHHDDEMRRSGRGRWLGLNKWRCENYAEIRQDEWVQTAVIPYLIDKYPLEYDRLLKWVSTNGGVDIPLKALAGELRIAPAPGLVWLGYSIDSAVEDMFKNEANGMKPEEVMLKFAHDLHIGDHYEECLKSLQTLLLINPDNAAAMGQKADTLVHLEQYDEAEKVAQKCLDIAPDNLDALEAYCDINKERSNWRALEEYSLRGVLASNKETWKYKWFLEMHIIASSFLGDYQTAKEDAKALPEHKEGLNQRKQAFVALVAFLSNDVERAKQITNDILAEESVIGPASAILKAVKNKMIDILGFDEIRLDFSEYEKDFLTSRKIDELLNITL